MRGAAPVRAASVRVQLHAPRRRAARGQPGKALAFALAEAATAGTSAGIWIHLERRYPDGVVPGDEAAHVRSLQEAEIGTGVAFFGVAAWGVIDAITHWRSRVEIAPSPVAGGAGLALGWRF